MSLRAQPVGLRRTCRLDRPPLSPAGPWGFAPDPDFEKTKNKEIKDFRFFLFLSFFLNQLAAVFLPRGVFERLLEDLGLPASSCRAVVAARHLQGSVIRRRHDLFADAAAVRAPLGHQPRRHVKSWFGAMPGRRATKLTVIPGSNFDDPNVLRRCPAPTALNRCDDLNSIRRIGLNKTG
jgi:hypothetical protein